MADWTTSRISHLRALHAEGIKADAIARHLATSRGAIYRKLDELGLGRPKRKAIGMYAVLALKASSCRWPIGDPQDSAFKFCAKRREFPKPYCSQHLKEASR